MKKELYAEQVDDNEEVSFIILNTGPRIEEINVPNSLVEHYEDVCVILKKLIELRFYLM